MIMTVTCQQESRYSASINFLVVRIFFFGHFAGLNFEEFLLFDEYINILPKEASMAWDYYDELTFNSWNSAPGWKNVSFGLLESFGKHFSRIKKEGTRYNLLFLNNGLDGKVSARSYKSPWMWHSTRILSKFVTKLSFNWLKRKKFRQGSFHNYFIGHGNSDVMSTAATIMIKYKLYAICRE